MATQEKKNENQPIVRKPISNARRQIIDSCYNSGEQSVKANKFDYAAEMFAQCVAGDPGSVVYLKSLMDALQKKYSNNKKGINFSGMKGMSAKGRVKKAAGKGDWEEAVKAGLELIALNPWDASALLQLATAVHNLGCYDTEQHYLKYALETDVKNIEINKTCAEALTQLGLYDQAIACWFRIEKIKPGNEEALKKISGLQVDKTIKLGGLTDDGLGNRAKKGTNSAASVADAAATKVSRDEQMLQEHSQNPADIAKANEVAETLARDEKYDRAEKVLEKTLDATGGDIKVREHLEDMQLRRARHQSILAEKRYTAEPTPEGKELAKQMKVELNRVEMDVYRARSERYPGNTNNKYEYALRLKRAGKYNDAIKAFQEARGDPKRKGTVFLELGECFQYIKQYRLAMTNYAQAIENLTEREMDQRNLALYRAGVLATGMEDLDAAEKYLTILAGHDFGYKDVSERLDKITKTRNKR